MSSALPIQPDMTGPRTSSPKTSRKATHRDHHLHGDEPLPHETASLFAVVGAVDRPHERRHRADRRPEGENEADDDHREASAPVLVHPAEAVLDELRRLGRDNGAELVDQRRDRVRARKEREETDGHEEHSGDGEERVVRERGREVRDAVRERLLAGPGENRLVVLSAEVGEPGIVQLWFPLLGLRRRRFLRLHGSPLPRRYRFSTRAWRNWKTRRV